MSRKAHKTECSESDRQVLMEWARGRKQEARLVERAKMILQCIAGKTVTEIAREMKIRPNTVIDWRKRFEQKGLEGLYDLPRTGKPAKYDKEFRDKILETLCKEPPKGQSTWDGPAVARHLGCSDDAVWRVLRKEGICLSRQRSWCISTDPEFVTKAADIVGLYLNPPDNAIVLSVDEKPSIQALERATGYVETSSGKIVRGYKSTYKRNGTLNLFAALEVATGLIHTQTTRQKRRVEFLEFMDRVLQGIDTEGKEIHVILDNYCTHKKNPEWLKEHPNVFFHYTPTSASWLNQVEIWFGILTRKALRGASFKGVEDIKRAIEDFVLLYTETAKPFVWRKREVRGSQLKYNIANLCN